MVRNACLPFDISSFNCSSVSLGNPVQPLGNIGVNAVYGNIAVYCDNHTKHINTLCGQNAEFYDLTADNTYSTCCVLKG
jgi:hypothetical protein